MGDKTGIEWTDATWNPVTGCTKVSPGCDHCYAESIAHRFDGTLAYPNGFNVTLRPERLDQPLRWRKPRRVFVNSMSDLFHDDIPDTFIARVFSIMKRSPQHTFQVLTKRPGRMRSLLRSEDFQEQVFALNGVATKDRPDLAHYRVWPIPNVWLGVSTEDQRWANIRIPVLLDTPAAVRFISAEPLLGPIDLTGAGTNQRYWLTGKPGWGDTTLEHGIPTRPLVVSPHLDWVIVGGESGVGARPMHGDWVRSLRDQCVTAGVAYHFKQWGEWIEDVWVDADGDRHLRVPPDATDKNRCVVASHGATALTPDNPFNPFHAGHPGWMPVRRVGKKTAGRELDGRTWDGFPQPKGKQ